MSTSLPQVMTDAERGIIPADLDACAALIEQCTQFELVAGNVRWMVIARARELFPADDGEKHSQSRAWRAWVKEHYPQARDDKHILHLKQIGDYLLRHCRNSVACNTIFRLAEGPLMALQALKDDRLDDFLDGAPRRYGKPLEAMTREQIREAVTRWNTGKADDTPAPVRRQIAAPPVQVDFIDALFACSAEDPHAFQRRVHERAATVDDALPVLNRALVVMDAMIGRLDRRRPEAFAVLAKTLRNEATRLVRMLADPGILSPVRPLSPPPELASPEDAVRRRLPAAAQEK